MSVESEAVWLRILINIWREDAIIAAGSAS